MNVTDRFGFRTDLRTIERLIQFRETTDARAFREWVQTVGEASPKDILEQLNAFKVKIGHIACLPSGKALPSAASILIDIAAEVLGAFTLERGGAETWSAAQTSFSRMRRSIVPESPTTFSIPTPDYRAVQALESYAAVAPLAYWP